MPYKFIVSVDSLPFSSAPPVIRSALGRLVWAAQNTVKSAEFQQLNELLAVGYFEDMEMGVSSYSFVLPWDEKLDT